VTAFLIDEMFPPAAAELLRNDFRHNSVHVGEIGLIATEHAQVAATPRAVGRAVVTENVADFAGERDVILIFILKRKLPAGKAQAAALATVLDGWARANPDPYRGSHWPTF
jgi:hypothetical protein